MKRVLILELLSKSFGGVWQVNKIIGEKLISLGCNSYIVQKRGKFGLINFNNKILVPINPQILPSK